MQNTRYFDRYFQVGLADDDASERRTQFALEALANNIDQIQRTEVLTSIIFGQDEERSALALDTARDLRRNSQSTSHAILNYAERLRSALSPSGKLHSVRHSTLDRWRAGEVFLESA